MKSANKTDLSIYFKLKMTSDINSFQENVENVVNSKVWVKIIDCLKQLKDWFFSVITKETEVNAKKKYIEMFNSLKNQIFMLANHADIMLPRLDDNKFYFGIIQDFLKSDKKDEDKGSCLNALKIVRENLEGFKELDKHRKETSDLLAKVAEYQGNIQTELNNIENLLTSRPIKHKKTAAGILGAVGAGAGGSIVGTLIAVEILGGCGKLVIAGFLLTTPLQLAAVVAGGALVGALVLGKAFLFILEFF